MNLGRLLLCLLASASMVLAATVSQPLPQGLVVGKGQVLEYDNEVIQTPSVTIEGGWNAHPSRKHAPYGRNLRRLCQHLG